MQLRNDSVKTEKIYSILDEVGLSMSKKQLLGEEAYFDAIEEYGDDFDAQIGGEAIQNLLTNINLDCEVDLLLRFCRHSV